MARIIVTADPAEREGTLASARAPVLLDERVYAVHMRDGHAANQLLERLAWAVGDAEARERAAR